MIGSDHHSDREKWPCRVVGKVSRQANDTARKTCESSGFQQHMLVENAAPKRLHRHNKNVACHSEYESYGESADQPGRYTGQSLLCVERDNGSG